MADIKHTHHTPAAPTGPTEGDGISYKGIGWFVVILAGTTLACQLLVWWGHEWYLKRLTAADTPRSPFATANQETPQPNAIHPSGLITLDTWHQENGQPKMQLGEPTNLQRFRDSEDNVLGGYGWIDQNNGVVRIPIDRAKELLLQRGLPARTGK
jgi:hypothetical protein